MPMHSVEKRHAPQGRVYQHDPYAGPIVPYGAKLTASTLYGSAVSPQNGGSSQSTVCIKNLPYWLLDPVTMVFCALAPMSLMPEHCIVQIKPRLGHHVYVQFSDDATAASFERYFRERDVFIDVQDAHPVIHNALHGAGSSARLVAQTRLCRFGETANNGCIKVEFAKKPSRSCQARAPACL